MAYKRKTPRPLNVTVYLGDKDKRIERVAKLDAIASSFGVTRSILIQKICDGELLVIAKPSD